MWAHNGWRVRAEDTNEVLIPGGDKLQMSRRNGLPTVKMYAATDEGRKNADFGTLIATGEENKMVLLWHARLALSTRNAKDLPQVSTGTGVKEFSDNAVRTIEFCEVRKLAGFPRKPYGSTPGSHRAAKVGGRVVVDVWGKYSIPAAGTNHNFIIGGEDEFSGYGLAMTSAHHTSDDMLEYIARFNDEVMAAGHPEGVKIVRHDHATEMTNDRWRNGLKELKITDESTIPYEKEGVGKAERSWGMMLPTRRGRC